MRKTSQCYFVYHKSNCTDLGANRGFALKGR